MKNGIRIPAAAVRTAVLALAALTLTAAVLNAPDVRRYLTIRKL
ncbi:hypothetical protein PJ985_13225 [Streptomyces sp. ACA25]|nr:hypothetical protein [Streptomyces sp. ACA25]MDB1088529.1 hypothetical protein [Streptomyces sp. ACA25]